MEPGLSPKRTLPFIVLHMYTLCVCPDNILIIGIISWLNDETIIIIHITLPIALF